MIVKQINVLQTCGFYGLSHYNTCVVLNNSKFCFKRSTTKNHQYIVINFNINRMHFAVISGLCASLASLFGKLSGSPTFQGFLILRFLFFGLMLTCNAAVWTFYVKALHSSDSTLSATVVSTATNYVLSAIFGFFLFDESTSLLWWAGMSLVLMGLVLIVKDEENNITDKSKKLKKL